MGVAVVIHFCSNDLRFFHKNVEEAKKISDCVIIPICDHFFNGEPENRQKLNWIYREFPDCHFIEFEYDANSLYTPYVSFYSQNDRGWGHCWHATSRLIAELFAPSSHDYLLFLDADEIAEGNRMRAWIDTGEYRAYSAIRFYSFFYLRQNVRAQGIFPSPLLIKRSAIDPMSIVQHNDRSGIYRLISEPKKQHPFQKSEMPFFHHYPWVRTKGECLHKSETWGHRHDRDWKTKIEEFFEEKEDPHPLGMQFAWNEAPSYFDPLSVEILWEPIDNSAFPHVRKISRVEAMNCLLERASCNNCG